MSPDIPKVYIATYSSTDVYECQINESPIMRRCKDDWVNATQILKCCNFPKAKRTKILEKGVQQGLHEKIQGGYGRFQGTWIPLPDAQRLAASYGVTSEIAPVLYLDLSDPNIQIPKKVKQVNKDGTPVKRKYTKKNKKPEDTPSKKLKTDKQKAGSSQEPYNHPTSLNSISRYPSHLSSQSSQPTPTHQNQQIQYQIPPGQLRPTFTQSDFLAMNGNAHNVPTFTSHQQAVQHEFQNYQMQLQHFQQQQKFYPRNIQFPPQMQQQIINQFHHNRLSLSQSTNDTNWSQEDTTNNKDSDTSISSNEGSQLNRQLNGKLQNGNLIADVTQSPKNDQDDDNSYPSQLLKFFSEDNSQIPYFIHNPPYDFNINEPIDDEGHTPLHWAASIGNYSMIHLLLSKGASPLVVNNFGLNPLSKSISFNNCYELKNFPKVLDDLELCLINTDINGRTPLHYLCQFVKVKSKYESLRYYLNTILTKLTSLSNQNASKQIDLLKNVLDHQDVNGDTCLHLAAKSGSSKIVKVLLDYGARDDLENINKETAKMLIGNYNLLYNYDQPQQLLPPQEPQQNYHSTQNNQRRPREPPHHDQVLATPLQPQLGSARAETPDTQRTTVQEDDLDDEDIHTVRVNKEQLDNLMKNEDNKENVFIDDSSLKGYDAMSTPISKHQSTLNPSTNHEPLAVISERTDESTPIRSDHKKFIHSFCQTYKPQPPKLDDEGRIIEDKNNANRKESNNKLSMTDLSSMVNGMINSLSDSYNQEMTNLDDENTKLEEELKKKQELNNSSIGQIVALLNKSGIKDFKTIDEGKSILLKEINSYEEELNNKETSLLKASEQSQAYQLANLVKENESKCLSDNNANDNTNENEKWKFAIELSQLQLQRNDLTKKLAKCIRNFGIDNKMYKYRKLISLSCGLKVEDIDSLIDGIEESLMETSMS